MARDITETSSISSDHQPGGLKTQLFQLLPRHATFQVKLTVHQLDGVPQLKGRFLTKWKFKNVQSKNVQSGNTTLFPWRGKAKDAGHGGLQQSRSHEDLPSTSAAANTRLTPNSVSSIPTGHVADIKGYTAPKDLANYAVVWEETITAAVQFSIKRENGALLPNELRLVVRQV